MIDDTIGNQQERLQTDIYWFAGFFDAEGSISIETNIHKQTYSPKAIISNTDIELINRSLSILEALNIPHYVRTYKSKQHQNRKVCYNIIIAGLKRCEKLLKIFANKLVCKKEKAELILDFIKYRMTQSQNMPYKEKEREFIYKIMNSGQSFNDVREIQCRITWLSGLIDGDGCIGILKSKNAVSPHLTLTTTSNTAKNEVYDILKSFNVPVVISKQKHPYENWNDTFRVKVCSKVNLIKVLPKLIPLLTSVKKKKAKIIYDMCKLSRSQIKERDFLIGKLKTCL